MQKPKYNKVYRYSQNTYSYNNITGILTLSDSKYGSLQSTLDILENLNSDIQDYEAYYIFEVKIEKYRAIDPDNPVDNHIATMQAIEQSILEYAYQFKHAQKTQQGLSEMFYTFFVTSISTVITTAITLGVGMVASKLSSTSVKTAASGQLSKTATKQALNTPLKRVAAYFVRFSNIKSWQFLKLALSPLTETLQEIFVDPYLETIVTDIVAKAGFDVFWQVLASSLVEGGREGLTGPLAQFLRGDRQMSNDAQNLIKLKISPILDSTKRQSIIKTQEVSKTIKIQWSSIFKTGASLLLGTALIGIGGPMFFGASLVCGYSATKSFGSGFKNLKKITHNIIFQQLPSDYYLSNVIADEIAAINSEVLRDAIAEAQVSSFPGSRISATLFENVNSKSDFNGNLVKRDKIGFTSAVVEKVYQFLPSEQKYIIDEAGNTLELDPIGVVRTTLEIMDYQLDPAWYAWGTKAPKIVDLKNINYRGTQYEDILTKCENAGFELVTTENEWINLILHKGDKFPSQLKVKVKCKTEAGHITEKTVALIGKYGCKYCNGRYKNQRITHAITEELFADLAGKFEEEAYLVEILKEVGVDSKYQKYRKVMDVFRMKIDTFTVLNLKDKEGNLIKDKYGNEKIYLAIESQGPQHYRNEKGFKSFLFLNKFEGKVGDVEWRRLKIEWEVSLQRDQLKDIAFKNNNKNGYYLISVDNSLSANKRAGYILDQLCEQAGLDLQYLLTNVKINEILSRIL